MAESFTTTNRYFDNKHYPRGFSRHGDFTIKEAQLLERHCNDPAVPAQLSGFGIGLRRCFHL